MFKSFTRNDSAPQPNLADGGIDPGAAVASKATVDKRLRLSRPYASVEIIARYNHFTS